MTLVICHGGQTGVDRGAHLGAIDGALLIAGYMPRNERDERGMIPDDIRSVLWRCTVGERDGGYPARTHANIELAHAVLLIVQDVNNPAATPGSRLTYDLMQKRERPWMIADPDTYAKDVQKWMTGLREDHGSGELRLLVAGPRASRWANGEATARTLVASLSPNIRWEMFAGGMGG